MYHIFAYLSYPSSLIPYTPSLISPLPASASSPAQDKNGDGELSRLELRHLAVLLRGSIALNAQYIRYCLCEQCISNQLVTSSSVKSVREEYFVDNVSDKLATSDCDERVKEEYL